MSNIVGERDFAVVRADIDSQTAIAMPAEPTGRAAKSDLDTDAGDATYLAAMIDAPDVPAAWALHVARMADFGFDRMIYGYSRFQHGPDIRELSDAVVLTNHAPDYIEPWLTEGYVRHSPMARWAISNSGACSWRWIAEQAAAGTLTEAERRTLAFNRRMGVVAGYTISFGLPGSRMRGVIGLTARPGLDQDRVDALWARAGAQIEALNKLMHLRVTTLPHSPPERRLTRRQREVLEWVSDGKTSRDIAVIMGVTVPTVEKHLRLARAALDAETTAQAVLKAAYLHQIFTNQEQASPKQAG